MTFSDTLYVPRTPPPPTYDKAALGVSGFDFQCLLRLVFLLAAIYDGRLFNWICFQELLFNERWHFTWGTEFLGKDLELYIVGDGDPTLYILGTGGWLSAIFEGC